MNFSYRIFESACPNKEEFSTQAGSREATSHETKTLLIAWKHFDNASGEGIYNGDMGHIHGSNKKADKSQFCLKKKIRAYTFAEAKVSHWHMP
jgi:hypothetical protein